MEEVSKKKSNKGLVVTLIIIVVLLLCCLGFGGYKYLSLDKDYDKLNNKYESVSKTYEDLNVKYQKSNQELETSKEQLETIKEKENIDYKVYSEMGHGAIVGYNGELYAVTLLNSNDSGLNLRVSEINTCLDKAKFSNNLYECKSDSGRTVSIIKTGVLEKDVYTAVVTNNYSTADAMLDYFVIQKSGKVTNPVQEVFKGYKVKNVEEFCYKKLESGCKRGYKLVLQDGSIKTVTSLD